MTKNNKLTRPFAGAQFRTQIVARGILTHFSWNLNPDNSEWEIVKTQPEGTNDVFEFSSPSKAAAEDALQDLIERDYPGLLAQGRVR